MYTVTSSDAAHHGAKWHAAMQYELLARVVHQVSLCLSTVSTMLGRIAMLLATYNYGHIASCLRDAV